MNPFDKFVYWLVDGLKDLILGPKKATFGKGGRYSRSEQNETTVFWTVALGAIALVAAVIMLAIVFQSR